MTHPIEMHNFWQAWQGLLERQNETIRVDLIGPVCEARAFIRDLFLSGCRHVERFNIYGFAEASRARGEVRLVLLFADSDWSDVMLAAISAHPKQRVLVIVPDLPRDRRGARIREAAAAFGLSRDRIVAPYDPARMGPELAEALVRCVPDALFPLGRQFPFLRSSCAGYAIGAAAKTNALVGVIPIPGADWPVMTGNQVKLVLDLALIYDQPMNKARLKEVLSVLGGGLALRATARQLAKFVPGPGWLLAGAMGYAGTQALGRAAIAYFERIGDGVATAVVEESYGSGVVIDTAAEEVR